MRRTARRGLAAVLLAVLGAAPAPAQGQPVEPDASNPILAVMAAEIERARQLRMVSPQKPFYFGEVALFDVESLSGSATLGSLMTFEERHFRLPEVRVRVGDYEFDNTNFIRTPGSVRVNGFPLEDDADAMRHQLWLGIDLGFKAALGTMARKEAALQNVTQTEKIPDFAKAPANRLIQEPLPHGPESEAWRRRLEKVSAVFRGYPGIQESNVRVLSNRSHYYLANSEGTRLRLSERLLSLTIVAETQAADGMELWRAAGIYAREPGALVSDEDMIARAKQLAEDLVKLAEAPVGDAYVGPVLFEGEASPQLFAQLVGANLVLRRAPISDQGGLVPLSQSDFSARLGSRVLPSWIDVVDDPARKDWEGQPLIGGYAADYEGVAAAPLKVIDKGILKGFLLTRQPVREFRESNGRARLPGFAGAYQAALSNLIVTASETSPAGELKRQLLEMSKAQNKEYGYIVRSLEFPSFAGVASLGRLLARISESRDASNAISPPVLAYRVYADGREELVRGLQFRGLAPRVLRDIVAAAEGSEVFHFLNSGRPLAAQAMAQFVAESSVVAPKAVLIEEIELDRQKGPLPNLPIAPPPALE